MTTHTFRFGGLNVEANAATQYATIYDGAGKPVATLQRRRAYERTPEWTVYSLNGAKVASGELVRTCLRELHAWVAL